MLLICKISETLMSKHWNHGKVPVEAPAENPRLSWFLHNYGNFKIDKIATVIQSADHIKTYNLDFSCLSGLAYSYPCQLIQMVLVLLAVPTLKGQRT